jgi:hypothetical protein
VVKKQKNNRGVLSQLQSTKQTTATPLYPYIYLKLQKYPYYSFKITKIPSPSNQNFIPLLTLALTGVPLISRDENLSATALLL